MNPGRSLILQIEWVLQRAATCTSIFAKRHALARKRRVARTVQLECAPVRSGMHLYVLSLSLCVGLSCLSPKPAVAACAEDLTRIELALQNVSSDLRERLEPILVDAK